MKATITMHRRLRSPFPSSSSLLKSLLLKSLSTTTSSALSPPCSDLSSDVEKIYVALRSHQQQHSPEKLSSALRSLSLVHPLHHPVLLPRVLSRCGPSLSLSVPFLSVAASHPDFVHTPSLQKAIITLLARSRDFTSSWSLIQHLHAHKPHLISPALFVILIRRFAKAKLVSKAINVLDQMPLFDCPPNDRVFGSLLDALAKNDAVKEAAKLFDEMRERFPPKLHYFTSLLYGWCKAGKLEEARFVLVQMKDAGFKPDVVVFNTLVAGFSAADRFVEGYALLDEMRRQGCQPNVITYTTLIQGLCTREKMDEALRVFVEMQSHDILPDVVTYTTLIGGFAKIRRMEKAFEILDEMMMNGCRPNTAAYLPIFFALERKGDLEQCLELISKMSATDGCFPDLGIYNTTIRLACKHGELDRAAELWNEMEASGLSPSLDSFIIIIHGFVAHRSLIQACAYFREMVNRELLTVPQYGLMKDLLNSLLRDGNLVLAKEMWGVIASKGGRNNVYAWTIWIHALFARNHVKDACAYCLEMMDAEVMPQADTFARLMTGLKEMKNRELAAEITEKVRAMAAERKMTFKMYKRRGVLDTEKKRKRKKEEMERKQRGRRVSRGHSGRGRKNSFHLYRDDP